ncbi:hypothetical protein ACIHFC_04290 [Streptomyces sp. NPDC052013]|uniref:hypothetical protein n=1 Tax=Streptomyces sp. NPDC052013 TaxID=3365679 RepID=UPI0037CD2D81
MRRTVRALSLAAAAGTVLGVLAPVASASPPAPPEPGAATHSTCPPQKGHQQWEGQGGSAYEEDEAAEPEAEPDRLEAKSLAADSLAADSLAADSLEGDSLEGESLDDAESLHADSLEPETDAPGHAPEDSGEADPFAADESLASEDTAELSGSGARKPTPKPSSGQGKDPHCGRTPVPGGVHAGGGGSFTDSVPALAAGGLLIAGAFGAAAHRLYRRKDSRTHG